MRLEETKENAAYVLVSNIEISADCDRMVVETKDWYTKWISSDKL